MAKKTNFEVNGQKYYRVTRTVGHKPDGTPIKKTFYGSGINEANDKANEYMNKLKNGYTLDFEKYTLEQIMSKWIYQIKKYDDIKPSTFEAYESTFRLYIQNSDIANLTLFNVKAMNLQEYYNKLSKKGFSGAKIRKINKLLHQFFKYAINEGYILRNPTENITIPKLTSETVHKDEKIEYFSEDEVKNLIEKLKGNKLEKIVLFALGTGLRQGELLALRYSDIDFEKKQLKVNRTVKKVCIFDSDNNKITQTIFSVPKTINSIRVVDIPSNIIELIENKNTDELIFDDNGDVYEARKLFRHWSAFLKKNNIPHKKFHALRHTYATLLLNKGVDLITVSKLLGHSSVKITEIYAHVIPKTKVEAVDKLNSIFN